MKVTGPLFKWFGSKWLSSKKLPAPIHDVIIEPFAGSASYSLRHCEKNIILYESNSHLYSLWEWLLYDAQESHVREIPIGLPEGTDILSLGLSRGQCLLLKNWQRTNNVGDCWTVSPWGNKPGQWTANTRARVAEEISVVKHWIMGGRDGMTSFRAYNDYNESWFIDPPYQFNYQYRSAPIDYEALSKDVKTRLGQVIVCEAICPKTGAVPGYLPFEFFGSRITSRRKAENNHHSKELIYAR